MRTDPDSPIPQTGEGILARALSLCPCRYPDIPRFPTDFSFIMPKARLNILHLPGTLASQDRIKLFTLPLLLPFTKGKKLLRRKKILWKLTHPA